MASFLFYSFLAALIGFVTGIFSGLFGIGGGLVSTPLIRTLLGASPLVAVGTPLPAIVPSALTAGYSYWRRNQVDHEALKWCAFSGLPAMLAGAYTTRFLSGQYLLISTAVLILYIGIRFVVERKGGDSSEPGLEVEQAYSERTDNRAKYLATGLGAGFVGGLLGLGGGFLMIPLFVQWVGMPVRKAFGTSLLIAALISIPGSIVHFLLGHISIDVLILLIVGVLPGAYLGARLAFLTKEDRLRKGFGVLLMTASLYFAYAEFAKMFAAI